MKSMQVAPLAQALGPGNPGALAQHNTQGVGPDPEAQQCEHAASAKAASPKDQATRNTMGFAECGASKIRCHALHVDAKTGSRKSFKNLPDHLLQSISGIMPFHLQICTILSD